MGDWGLERRQKALFQEIFFLKKNDYINEIQKQSRTT